ncbi:MAG TPA: hypothetical protein PLY87_10385 [Planctomycetaceae bacterium]|nr:hypothetical protein [Planctomycetaceae bacterium]
MPFYESFDEFRTRMGCDHEHIGNRYLFRNAAQSDGELRHTEPPADPTARGKLNREFLTHRLKTTTAEFNDMKTYVAEQAALRLRYHNVPGPRENSVEILKRLQGRIYRLREAIQQIEADSPPSPEDSQEKVRQEIEMEMRARVSQLALEASQISI